MTLYMRVTRDKYELPEAVAEDAGTLARMCGVTVNTIFSQISRFEHDGKPCRWRRVEVEDDDEFN